MNSFSNKDPNITATVDPWGINGLPIQCGKPDKSRFTKILSFEGGTPGYFLSRNYQLSKSPNQKNWILWESIEDEKATSCSCVTYQAVACVPLEVGEATRAAKTLLSALWEKHRDGRDSPNCMDSFEADGILSDAEIRSLLISVWPSCPLVASDLT
jgi:hypothetical protein